MKECWNDRDRWFNNDNDDREVIFDLVKKAKVKRVVWSGWGKVFTRNFTFRDKK